MITVNHLGYSRQALGIFKSKRELPKWAERDQDSERNALIRAWQARVFTRVVPDGEEHLYRLGIALRNFAMGHMEQIDPRFPDFFSGVMYPSISTWLLADNVALLPSVVDSSLILERVIFLSVEAITESPLPDGGKSTAYQIRDLDYAPASRNDGRLVWNQESTALSLSSWQHLSGTIITKHHA